MMKEVKVLGITIDPVTNSPIVILRDVDKKFTLPIWIGVLEANSIAIEMEKMDLPRPMTHDLTKTIIDEFGGKVLRIEITDLKDNTYFAIIYIQSDGKRLQIDSRPSDAIALALRCEAAIYVYDSVLEKAYSLESEEGKEGQDRWSELLEMLNPEEFTKYKM
ncbi:MAG: bifunctional nuclease family protein [Deltaproteobacteria bacterium]|jgi:bifunctional DNase/RNase|nr:bifunctional nuclease family protein [Deltaproteobacteria bacterium]NIS75850.1 bifunctional nuclease family protein [Deltaproteobacteria bacterium]